MLPKLSAPILVLPLQTSKELCFVVQMIFFSIDDEEKHGLDRVGSEHRGINLEEVKKSLNVRDQSYCRHYHVHTKFYLLPTFRASSFLKDAVFPLWPI